MKDFLKYTFATLVGISLAGFLAVFFFVGALLSLVTTPEAPTTVAPNSVMQLKLNGKLVEHIQEDPIDLLSSFFQEEVNVYGLDEILSAIYQARDDQRIQGIYLQMHSLETSYASLQEIRQALQDFQASGKWIVAYADRYTQGGYYLASVADQVLLNPQGMIEWRGIAATPVFYKELLDKMGIEMQTFRVGTFKSAIEPFTAEQMSPANRAQMERVIHSTWEQLTQDVALDRKITVEQLNRYADEMLQFYPATKSVECRLADSLVYESEVKGCLQQRLGLSNQQKVSLLSYKEMNQAPLLSYPKHSSNVIAVYYASGEITEWTSTLPSNEEISGPRMVRDLQKLKDNDQVKAVVLRVNSPGGSAFASEQIWHAVKELKAQKPVVVSMGDYAASGGYYLACHANCILAEPTTLTGSIGIFGMVPNFQKLSEKIGIRSDVVKTNQYADLGNLMRPFNNEEKSLMQMSVNQGYATFLQRCAEGRSLPINAIEQVAEGRVWTGADALNKGLVDTLGGLKDAVRVAIQLADVAQDFTIRSYPEPQSMFASLLEISSPQNIQAWFMPQKEELISPALRLWKQLKKQSSLQARMPFEPNIN